MRLLVLFVSMLCAACLAATCAIAQSGQIPPYLTHVDKRHGSDHVYPDRGAVVSDLPRGAIAVNYAGISYRFAGGVWYERHGPAYIVVAPPIGLVVPELPAFATSLESGGKTYLYANDVFYRPRPDLGGYQVVNDPQDVVAEEPSAPGARGSPRPSPTRQAMADGSSPTSPPINPTGVAIQPHNGQSADQQALDRYECYRIAITQSGFDPLASNNGMPAAEIERRNADYSRAQATCLEGRGYTVP